MSKSKKKR